MDPWLEQFEARREARAKDAAEIAVGGVTLALKPGVAPQVSIRYFDVKRRLLEYNFAAAEAEKAGKPRPDLPDDLFDTALLDLMEETAQALLHPSSLSAWQQLRAPANPKPLTWRDLFDLVEYLIGRASGLPTEGPTASADGPPSTASTSKAASSSKAGTRKR